MSNKGDGDKRSVNTDALATIGNIIDEREKRDAIHLAVEPVTAAVKLYPGQDVGADGTPNAPHVGIVDPFLKAPVQAGERFWLVIYPREIHSLRHVWTHPAFEDEPEVAALIKPSRAESEKWLREFISTADCPGFETTIAVASGQHGEHKQWAADEYLHFDGSDAHGEIPTEFWDHLEIYTGVKPPHRPAHFSCAC